MTVKHDSNRGHENKTPFLKLSFRSVLNVIMCFSVEVIKTTSSTHAKIMYYDVDTNKVLAEQRNCRLVLSM